MNEFTNFAVMSYSFHGLKNIGAMNIFGYLETVRYRYNLQTADIWNGFLTDYDDAYLDVVKQNIDERGLSVVNLCCDGAHVWDNDVNVRSKNEEMAWKCLYAAEKFGAKTVRIDLGVRESSISDEQMNYVVAKFTEYSKKAAKFGAKLGPENHWGAACDRNQMNMLFNNMTQENFGILLHLGNWHGTTQEKDMYDLEFASKAMHIHINYEHCIDADRIMPALKKAGYKGCWSVESHKSTNEYNNVAFQLAQVRRVIAPMSYDGSWRVAPPSVVEGNDADKL